MANHKVTGITVTQTNVIDDLKQCVKLLENLDKLQVSVLDYYDIGLAKNMLKTVIKRNGEGLAPATIKL